MQVQNIECQIAQAQLGRYIAGDGMASEAIDQLEAHIAKCPDCKAAMQSKQAALEATLTGSTSKSHPAPDVKPSRPAPTKSSASKLAEALMAKAALMESAEKVKAAPASAVAVVETSAKPAIKPVSWKPIAYSGLLAAVLIGMSYLSKSDVLGTKAGIGLPEKATSPTPSPSAKPVPSHVIVQKPKATTPVVPTPTPSPSPKTSDYETPTVTPDSPDESETTDAVVPTKVPTATVKPVTQKPKPTVKVAIKPRAAIVTKPIVAKKPVIKKIKPLAVHKVTPVRHAKRVVLRARRAKAVRHAIVHRSHHAAPVAHHGIRVYDASGKPIAG